MTECVTRTFLRTRASGRKAIWLAMTRDVGPRENRSSFMSICSRKVLREDAKDWTERKGEGRERKEQKERKEREREREGTETEEREKERKNLSQSY